LTASFRLPASRHTIGGNAWAARAFPVVALLCAGWAV
jgi:hypothetical protein